MTRIGDGPPQTADPGASVAVVAKVVVAKVAVGNAVTTDAMSAVMSAGTIDVIETVTIGVTIGVTEDAMIGVMIVAAVTEEVATGTEQTVEGNFHRAAHPQGTEGSLEDNLAGTVVREVALIEAGIAMGRLPHRLVGMTLWNGTTRSM